MLPRQNDLEMTLHMIKVVSNVACQIRAKLPIQNNLEMTLLSRVLFMNSFGSSVQAFDFFLN